MRISDWSSDVCSSDLEGEDVLATAAAMRSMGATIIRENDGTWVVDGVGVGGLLQPEAALEMGNSGTSTRLLMGLVATHPITTTFTGDASRSEEHTSELQSLMRISYAVFCLKKKNQL